MKTIQLNIGLSTPSGAVHSGNHVLAEVHHITNPFLDHAVIDWKLEQGQCEQGAEPVLCVLVSVPDVKRYKERLNDLAIALAQDCIAIAYSPEHGELIGPRPYAGGFDPEFFQYLEWPDSKTVEGRNRFNAAFNL